MQLDIHPKNASSYYRDICSTMFTAVLIILVRYLKQLRCPSTKDYMKNMYICGLEYYSALKNDIMKSISKWIELEKTIILSKVFQTLKEKYFMYLLICRY